MRYYTRLRALLRDLPSIKNETIVVANTVNVSLISLNAYDYRSLKSLLKRQNITVISFRDMEAYNEFKAKNKAR